MDVAPRWRISAQAWFALLALGVALLLVVRFAGLIVEVFWIVFGAVLINLALRPVAERLVKRVRIPRGITVALVYLAALGLIFGIGVLLVPVLSSEIAQLRENGPALLQAVVDRLSRLPGIGREMPTLQELAQAVSQRLSAFALAAAGLLESAGEFALEVLVVLVLAFFFVTDEAMGERLVTAWVPEERRDRVRRVVEGMSARLRHWAWAQLASAGFFAVAFGVGLWLLGVPFALSIALVGGVLEIVPFLGSTTALLLAALSALTVGPWSVLWVLLLHQAVVHTQGELIAPYFFGRVVGLHSGLILLALLIGAKAAGIVGALFAVPLTVVLTTLLEEVRTTYLSPEAADTIGTRAGGRRRRRKAPAVVSKVSSEVE